MDDETVEEKKPIIVSSFSGTAWIADIILILFSLYLFLFSENVVHKNEDDNEFIIVQFIIVLTVIPWYTGYLLHHFERFPKWIRRSIQWIYALITLGLVIFLVILFFPIMENNPNPTSFQLFLVGFGMFFMVLGPMMMIGGYVDAPFLDQLPEENKPVIWPQVTLVMFIIILSILFMILIIGFFDPKWEGNMNFFAFLLAFFGGPVLAFIVAVPFVMLGKLIEKRDKKRIFPLLLRFALPVIFFYSLLTWNDIVLDKVLFDWASGELSPGLIFSSMLIAGIIPFRILLMFKPPFSLFQLFCCLIALFIYLLSVQSSYGV